MPLFVEIRTPENVLVRHALAGMATRADAFARDLVVQGTVNDDMTVEADEVLVKCPSRYEGNPPTAHEKPQASL